MPMYHLADKRIILDARRLIDACWTDGLIAKVLSRRYGVRLSAKCISIIRKGDSCSESCPQWCR